MTIDTWLRMAAIGLPLIGVLAIWGSRDKFLRVRDGLVAVLLGLNGLAALSLFMLNRHYGCILSAGKGNCLFDGLATLSLFLLNAILFRSCIVLRGGKEKYDYILMLLLSSAWAGMGLIDNLLVLLIFLNLFFYVIHKWLERNGLGWRFLILRDDYQDEPNREYDDQNKL